MIDLDEEIAEKLLECSTVSDVTELIMSITYQQDIEWRPVGDRENNYSTINIGSDPAASVIERVTNAIDAILEHEWNEKGQPDTFASPRQAVEKWFRIKEGHLGHLKQSELSALDGISNKVVVTLRDSERSDKPTVDIRDFGIGIEGHEFAESILSLNGKRKLRKKFLSGAFGQGGSTAFSFSPYTIIMSLKDSGDGGELRFTIVRYNNGTADDKYGMYEYMVRRNDRLPLKLDATDVKFPQGTLVRHIAMDVGKYSSVMTAPTGSFWYLVHHYLFDPVLPFQIEDVRKEEYQKRTVTGNHRRLTQGEHTEYHESALLSFRDGKVKISWWVLSAEGEKAKERIKNYVLPSKPIVVTYNGQKQGEFPNIVIREKLQLPFLDSYLVVHVDCDKMDSESRKQLFATTRETLRDTPIGDDLLRLLIDTLKADDSLRIMDQNRKMAFIKEEDQDVVSSIRKRLAKRIDAFTGTGGKGDNPTLPTRPQNQPHPSVLPPSIPIQEPPSYLKIKNPSPRTVEADKSFALSFETDARPEYFSKPETFVVVVTPPTFAQYTGTTSVSNGYGKIYFKSSASLEVGATARVTLEVRPPNSASVSASIDVQIKESSEKTSGDKKGSSQVPNISPRWVSEKDAFWIEQEWNYQSVAAVVRTKDAVDIFVSADNEKLSKLIAKAQRKGAKAVDAIKGFYLEHITYFALVEEIDRKKRSEEASSVSTTAEATQVFLMHACDGICGIIDQLFHVLIDNVDE